MRTASTAKGEAAKRVNDRGEASYRTDALWQARATGSHHLWGWNDRRVDQKVGRDGANGMRCCGRNSTRFAWSLTVLGPAQTVGAGNRPGR